MVKLNLFISSLVVLTLAACGSSNSQSSTPAPAPPNKPEAPQPTPQPTPARVVAIPIEKVTNPEGCLNVQKLYEQMAALGADVDYRTVTTAFQIASGQGSAGNRPTQALIQRFARGAYTYTDQAFEQFLGSQGRVTQQGCDSVQSDHGDDGIITEKIVGWTANQLTLESKSEQRVLDFSGGNELHWSRKFRDLNFCNREEFSAQKTDVITWDVKSALTQKPQGMDRDYLQTLVNALASPPANLEAAITRAGDQKTVVLTNDQLQAINQTDLRPELKRCPQSGSDSSGD